MRWGTLAERGGVPGDAQQHIIGERFVRWRRFISIGGSPFELTREFDVKCD